LTPGLLCRISRLVVLHLTDSLYIKELFMREVRGAAVISVASRDMFHREHCVAAMRAGARTIAACLAIVPSTETGNPVRPRAF